MYQALNEQFSVRLHQQLGRGDAPVDEAVFISIDRTGADVRLRKSGEYCVQRLSFPRVSSWSDCLGLCMCACACSHTGSIKPLTCLAPASAI